MAMGVLRAFAEAGRAIPDEVSIVGFDDVPEAEFQIVPLTTVAIDADQAAERVLAELVSMIEGAEPSATEVRLCSRLVIRSSTGSPADNLTDHADRLPCPNQPPPTPAATRSANSKGHSMSNPFTRRKFLLSSAAAASSAWLLAACGGGRPDAGSGGVRLDRSPRPTSTRPWTPRPP